MKDVLNDTKVEKNKVLLLPHEGVIITLLCITVMLVTMNTAMFNLALYDLSQDFHLPSSIISLTGTSYSIMFAITSITYSRLSNFCSVQPIVNCSSLVWF